MTSFWDRLSPGHRIALIINVIFYVNLGVLVITFHLGDEPLNFTNLFLLALMGWLVSTIPMVTYNLVLYVRAVRHHPNRASGWLFLAMAAPVILIFLVPFVLLPGILSV